MKVTIEKMGINGEGIGYVNKLPVFIDGVLLHEEVDIEITDKQKTYAFGRVKKLITYSESRIKPRCKVQSRCGACPLMICDYKEQLNIKRDGLVQALIKYAHVNPKLVEPLISNQASYHYRNQFKLPLAMEDGQIRTGMYMPKSNYFIAVDNCLIHENELERLRISILKIFNHYNFKPYDYHQKKGIRTLIARVFGGKFQVTIVSGEHPLAKEVIDDIMAIDGVVSLWQSYNTLKKTVDIFGPKMILLAGERYLPLEFDHLKLQISPRSFFQLNTFQAKQLYRTVSELVGNGNELIVEAYSGIGAISLYIADKATEIIGIESIKDAVINANANAVANKISNVKFVCDDAASKLVYISKKRSIDVLIVDPPRSGLDINMLSCIMQSKIKTVIYVSCNPATLGKNLAVLLEKYNIECIKPIDMFSQTAHVETIVKLIRKK
ncbi:MAG: 23S rRNA (uracil(1939)-C(5))-methyltransferase RlmD [Erysipelotrichaceae bacterium]